MSSMDNSIKQWLKDRGSILGCGGGKGGGWSALWAKNVLI